MKSGRKLSFNLKSFEREKALQDAWRAMHGDPKYADKKFRITTRENEKYEMLVDDIAVFEFDPAEYFKADPEDVHTVDEIRRSTGYAHEYETKEADELARRFLHRFGTTTL
jgi:acyl CoA:acetate/3-ketoacid CoA transferase beta subunit